MDIKENGRAAKGDEMPGSCELSEGSRGVCRRRFIAPRTGKWRTLNTAAIIVSQLVVPCVTGMSALKS